MIFTATVVIFGSPLPLTEFQTGQALQARRRGDPSVPRRVREVRRRPRDKLPGALTLRTRVKSRPTCMDSSVTFFFAPEGTRAGQGLVDYEEDSVNARTFGKRQETDNWRITCALFLLEREEKG